MTYTEQEWIELCDGLKKDYDRVVNIHIKEKEQDQNRIQELQKDKLNLVKQVYNLNEKEKRNRSIWKKMKKKMKKKLMKVGILKK